MTELSYWDLWESLNRLMTKYRETIRASEPVGDDEFGWFVNVQGTTPEELTEWVLQETQDGMELAQLTAAAVTALVLRDYQHGEKAPQENTP